MCLLCSTDSALLVLQTKTVKRGNKMTSTIYKAFETERAANAYVFRMFAKHGVELVVAARGGLFYAESN